MKYFFFSLLIVSTSFASEIDRGSFCDSAVARVSAIQRELTEVSADIVREHSGPEEFLSESSSSSSGFNCEEVQSHYSILISRRDRLLLELKAAEQERAYRCPRSRPE